MSLGLFFVLWGVFLVGFLAGRYHEARDWIITAEYPGTQRTKKLGAWYIVQREWEH